MEQIVGTAEWLKTLLVHLSVLKDLFKPGSGKHWFAVTE